MAYLSRPACLFSSPLKRRSVRRGFMPDYKNHRLHKPQPAASDYNSHQVSENHKQLGRWELRSDANRKAGEVLCLYRETHFATDFRFQQPLSHLLFYALLCSDYSRVKLGKFTFPRPWDTFSAWLFSGNRWLCSHNPAAPESNFARCMNMVATPRTDLVTRVV